MQIISDKVRQDEGSYIKFWRNLEFFAGREKSSEIFDHSKRVFDRAFEMVDISIKAARNSGDKETLDKLEKIKIVWEEKVKTGVLINGIDDLNRAMGKTARISTTPSFTQLSDGLKNSDVNLAVGGLQGAIDPYARELWGDDGEASNKLDELTEQSKQYRNKSEAIIKAPLWRRGLERIWQAFGGVNDSAEQMAILRNTVNRLYAEEAEGKGIIGQWFEEYSHKSFTTHVLSKARETGSIYGMKTTIENAIENPANYSAHSWKGAEAEVIRHFKTHAKELDESLEKILDVEDPKLTEINYASIELAKSINSMRGKLDKDSELGEIVEHSHRIFEKEAKRLRLNVLYVSGIDGYDFASKKAEEEFKNLQLFFEENYDKRRLPIFESAAEIDDLFKRMERQFVLNYVERQALFGKLLRGGTEKTSFEELSAPVLL
ncbi:MAG: hypothetical protein KGH71_00680 [Candidatus Micrarchaeota archaeon]|nr:hypothetical protein [Candidatus Micrarchaeota archaeon]